MGIPENLKRLRAHERLSQSALARKAGVAQQLISQLERGENLTTKMLPQIARALNVSIAEVDPNFASEIGARDELARIYERLGPDWQAYLLDQARQLELRVRGSEARPAPKAVDGR